MYLSETQTSFWAVDRLALSNASTVSTNNPNRYFPIGTPHRREKYGVCGAVIKIWWSYIIGIIIYLRGRV